MIARPALFTRLICIGGVLLVSTGGSAAATSPRAAATAAASAVQVPPQGGAGDQAEALLRRARESGLQFVNTNDRRARDAARKDLDEAEDLAKAEARRNPACANCVEVQAAVHFFRAYFKFANEYDECVEVATRGLAQFPQSARLAYFKGYAHYARNEAREAAAALNRFLVVAPNDPLADQVRQLVNDSQQRFLGGWYNQANFYQSNESRIIAFNPQTNRNELVFQVTPEYELQLGQMGFTQISQEAPAANDPDAVAFLQQLAQRLVQKTPGPGFNYQVTVLDSPQVNAVTPPGHIMVYTGLLRFVDTEAQLAGVLAHELAHNYGHHSARQLIKAYHAQQLAATVTKAINPQSAVSQVLTQLTARVGVDLFLKAYSRFEEQEADYYGAHLMLNGGYNPTSMSSFLLKMYQANPRQPIKFLSTHPPHSDRINNLSDYLEAFPLDRELVVDSSEAFKKLKERYPSAAPITGPAVPAFPGGNRPPSPPIPTPSAAPLGGTLGAAPQSPRPGPPPSQGPPPANPSGMPIPPGGIPGPPPVPPGAPLPPPLPPMPAMVSLGVWGPATGGLQIAFGQTGELVEGRVTQVPAAWLPRVRVGDVVFVNGVRDGGVVRGWYLNVPRPGDCPALSPKFSSATVEFTDDTLTITTNEFPYSTVACTWSDVSEPRQYRWSRIPR
jgi:Zn-dependent protease with chaperone function